ncbi:ATP-binding protein [Natronomonas amylolytica]|uniref:ATP-binding protein n=1 Tax=Natronomonas amylolytica TaxID=3108498 RepID=UPI00300AAB76
MLPWRQSASLSETDSSRTYFKIEPAAEAADPTDLERAFRRLHRGSQFQLECLLIARGDGVEYYLGTDADDDRTVRHMLHTVFPEETSVTTPETSPQEILAELPTSTTDAAQSSDEDTDADASEPPAAAVRYLGWGTRRDDWQMQLQPAVDPEQETIQSPLSGIVDALAATPADTVAVYQALLEPYEDWSVKEGLRRDQLEWNRDTRGQRLSRFIMGKFEKPDEDGLTRGNRERLAELEAAAPKKTWAINARLYVGGDGADAVVDDLERPFGGLDGEFYSVSPHRLTGEDAHDMLAAIRKRRHRLDHGLARRLGKRLPIVPNTRPAIFTDPATAPAFWFLDGDALTQPGRQALDTTPGEQSGVTPPTDDQLDRYDRGLTLGRLLDADDERTDRTIALPPTLQPLHAAWFGKTGAGKSVALIRAIYDNIVATDGPTILIDSKGDGMAEDLLKAHYRRHGDLDNVYYFDCDRFVPAIPFFDISDDIEAGVPRATAVEDKVDHYIEILEGIMGEEAFQSKRAPDVIRYLLKAMYDPVHGGDAFTQSEFDTAVKRMTQRQSPPAVSDPHLERMLSGVAADRSDVFQSVMQGVNGRIEKVSRDSRTARLFEHTPPADTAASTATPSFDLADHLDEDAVIILDTGGLRTEAQRALVLVVLSNLWAALRKRERRRDQRAAADDPPLVNLYVEEAADIADTSLMSDLLAKSRGFGLSVTLAMQFPAQLRESSPRVYDEVLNNVSTLVTGNVGRDTPLAERLATDDMPPSDVANRLRGLRRGQWLAKLPAGFDDPEPRPFLLASADPPAGHPASDDPLSPARLTAFDAALHLCRERTREQAGLTVAQPSTVDDGAQAGPETPGSEDADETDDLRPRVDTTLPYTKRLPDHVTYDADRHALECLGCDTRYDPNSDGMERVLKCCPDGEIDADDIPICDVTLKLTREERRELDYTDGQLMFLKAVYNAAQLRYEEPAYDLLTDSMLRLREYVGVEADAVDELLDDGLLRHDTDHPHRLYTVSPEGRELLGEEYRLGVDHGHATGDLGESTQHIMGVEIARRWLHQEYVRDPDSPVETVVPYFELDESVIADDIDRDESGNASRLDIAGLDDNGEVAVCIEVERINNDVAEAVPADFDKMAACDPEEAIWVVMSQSAGHDVLQALNKSDRVEKTYANTTPPQQFRIDEPGLTGMYPITWVRERLE